MTITLTPLGSFDGGASISNVNYSMGETRKLDGIVREAQTAINLNETNITGLGTPLDLKGSVTLAADFPTILLVEIGWTYIVAADVTDNGGALLTNTSQSFKAGDEITWNGTNWTRLGRKVTELTAQSYQGTAATAATQLFMAMSAGKIKSMIALAGTAAAVHEDMAIDVLINGTSCLTAAVTVDDSSGTTAEVGVINTAANTLARGDVITVARTYTPGGSATPMTDTHVGVSWEEELSV